MSVAQNDSYMHGAGLFFGDDDDDDVSFLLGGLFDDDDELNEDAKGQGLNLSPLRHEFEDELLDYGTWLDDVLSPPPVHGGDGGDAVVSSDTVGARAESPLKSSLTLPNDVNAVVVTPDSVHRHIFVHGGTSASSLPSGLFLAPFDSRNVGSDIDIQHVGQELELDLPAVVSNQDDDNEDEDDEDEDGKPFAQAFAPTSTNDNEATSDMVAALESLAGPVVAPLVGSITRGLRSLDKMLAPREVASVDAAVAWTEPSADDDDDDESTNEEEPPSDDTTATTPSISSPVQDVKPKPKTKHPRRKRTRAKHNVPLDLRVYIADNDVTDVDVLLGRGGFSNKHIGNKAYLAHKAALQATYRSTSKYKKTAISQALVNWVWNRGGRFLERDPQPQRAGYWYIVADKRALQKASQALREAYTPESRALKRKRYSKKK